MRLHITLKRHQVVVNLPQCRVILSVRQYAGSYKFRSDNTLIVIGMCIILGNTTVFLVEEIRVT